MFESALFQWIGSIIAGGGIGAAITYIFTFKSNKRMAEADASTHEEQAEQAKIETARNLLIEELSVEQVARCTGLPLEKVKELSES